MKSCSGVSGVCEMHDARVVRVGGVSGLLCVVMFHLNIAEKVYLDRPAHLSLPSPTALYRHTVALFDESPRAVQAGRAQ